MVQSLDGRRYVRHPVVSIPRCRTAVPLWDRGVRHDRHELNVNDLLDLVVGDAQDEDMVQLPEVFS